MLPLIIAVLWGLGVILCREWVKNDLRKNICRPISVRWRFFASGNAGCAFKVVYSDYLGQLHRARCRSDWHRPRVIWESDQIIAFHDTFG